MKLKRDRQPARVALIIFSTLIVFCIGQLSWWIIFHINSGEERRQLHLDSLRSRSNLLAIQVNRDFDQPRRMVEMFNSVNPKNNIESLNQLLNEPAVCGYQLKSETGNQSITNGRVDSTFYASISPEMILFFNPDYPKALIGKDSIRLVFVVEGYHDGAASDWVSPSMFIASDEWMADLDEKSRGTTVMFAAEGGFFFLIILFGAFLIYRTLYRAEELKFSQQNFIHSVTHELKAPLASIRLYLETIMAGKVDKSKADELFPKMIEDCDRLEGLMDNVLEAGHFGKTGYKLKLTRTNLSEDLKEYLDKLENLADRYGGSIERDIQTGIIVKSDYQSLRRMVNALVDNAFKYSPPEKRRIVISLNKQEHSCIIRVRDNGIGIEGPEQSKVFDRFYRGNLGDTRSARGTGLGLFLVHEIVEAHGGKVKIESPGREQGSEFVVSLPLDES